MAAHTDIVLNALSRLYSVLSSHTTYHKPHVAVLHATLPPDVQPLFSVAAQVADGTGRGPSGVCVPWISVVQVK